MDKIPLKIKIEPGLGDNRDPFSTGTLTGTAQHCYLLSIGTNAHVVASILPLRPYNSHLLTDQNLLTTAGALGEMRTNGSKGGSKRISTGPTLPAS